MFIAQMISLPTFSVACVFHSGSRSYWTDCVARRTGQFTVQL